MSTATKAAIAIAAIELAAAAALLADLFIWRP